MKRKFDILITVYNKEKYLNKCLDSVSNQTYKNYNVIIVDDGSTDNSANIIKQYSEKYPNIIYYYKENTGVADTRNFAISKVESDFFLFVDADDYISLDLLDNLKIYCTKYVDIVSFSFYIQDEMYMQTYPIEKNTFPNISGKEAILKFNDLKASSLFDVPWGYAYRTEFFRKNKFEYLYGTEHEDSGLTPIIITMADNVISLKFKGYYYVQNENSITHNTETCNKRIVDKIRHLKNLAEFFYSKDFNTDEINLLIEHLLYTIWNISTYINKDSLHFFIKQVKELKVYEIVKSDSLTNKLKRFSLRYFPEIPMIFYLSYIFGDRYNDFDIHMRNFLKKMRLDGKDRYTRILSKRTSSRASYYLMRIRRTLLFTSNVLVNFPILYREDYVYLDYLEFCISTLCNLKCKHCSNLMPVYNINSKNIDTDYLLRQVDSLLKCVDYIDNLKILGGEPFLHPDLDKIIEKFISSKKVKRIIIATNGTILPTSPTLVKALKNNKVYINVSNYPVVKQKQKEFNKYLNKEGIHMLFYLHSKKDYYWIDYGDITYKSRSETELTTQFNNCPSFLRCPNLLNGKIYACPRSAHLDNLSIVKSNEYVDILDNKISNKLKKENIIKLIYSTKYLKSCNNCNIGTCEAKKIEPAEQL